MIPWEWYPKYIFETLKIATISCVMGIVVGVPLGLGKTKKNIIARSISSLYIWIFKGVPPLVQILMASGLLSLFFNLSNYACGMIALSGYASFRAGEMIESITNWFSVNSTDGSAKSKNEVGFSDKYFMNRIGCVFLCLYIHLIKESTLLSVIAVPELFNFTRRVMSQFSGIEAMFTTALIYIGLVFSLSQIFIFIRKKIIKDDAFFNDPNNVFIWS